LRNVAAGVERSDEIFGRFHARVGATFLQIFGLYQAISEGGENDNVFGLARQFLGVPQTQLGGVICYPRFDEVRDDRAVALVLGKVTGGDRLFVDQGDTVKGNRQVACT